MKIRTEAFVAVLFIGALSVGCGNTSGGEGGEYRYDDDEGPAPGSICPSGTLRCEDSCIPTDMLEELCPKPPPGCDLALEPKDSAACVDDEVGIFVSPKGSPNNPGTKARPVSAIPQTRDAMGDRKRIYVCEGTYTLLSSIEGTGLASQDRAIGLYGGFSCEDWSYNGVRPKVVTPDNVYVGRPALEVRNFERTFEVADFEFETKDAKSVSASSVGVAIYDSANVVLRRISVNSGKALPAAASGTETSIPWPVIDGQPPPPSDVTKGGREVPRVCDSATPASVGGKGGDGVGGPQGNGASGAANPPAPSSSGRDGAGGSGGTSSCQPGNSGADGAGKPAAKGAPTWGKLSETGLWSSTWGESATTGDVGQGGGGGGGVPGHGGSGGAPGGCGGGAGMAGIGAGSSFAILSIRSGVTVASSTLRPGDGGDGGAGGPGAAGMAGGKRNSDGACAGGYGGNGAGGGGGGGGAGGLSVGIAYLGKAPTIDSSTTVLLGKAGRGGAGGAGGPHGNNDLGTGNDGHAGGDGKAGVAAAMMALPN